MADLGGAALFPVNVFIPLHTLEIVACKVPLNMLLVRALPL